MPKSSQIVIEQVKTNCGFRPPLGHEMRYNGRLFKAVEIRDGWDSYAGYPDAGYDYFTVIYEEAVESADDE